MRIQPDELSWFFELLGKGTYYVQHLENSLHYLLAILEFEGPKSVTAEQAEAVLEKYRRKTLGGLVIEVERHADLGLSVPELRALNQERRWMIHQILKKEEYRLGSDPGYRASVFHRLERFVNEAQRLNKETGDAVLRVTLSKGTDRKALDAAIERELCKLD
jgi:hypothetical protein